MRPRYWLDLDVMTTCWKVKPYTQVQWRRLFNAYRLITQVKIERIPGDFVECGVWMGGCAALMAWLNENYGLHRKVWLYDSFEGMPEGTLLDGNDAGWLAAGRFGGELVAVGTNVAPIEDVRRFLFAEMGLREEGIVIEKGWFQHTLPRSQVGPISILRLDGDYYESTKVCLEHLYERVVPGGFVIVDDYWSFQGCKRAVDEFLDGASVDLIDIDGHGIYFRKSQQAQHLLRKRAAPS
jgi:hypothetical protein